MDENLLSNEEASLVEIEIAEQEEIEVEESETETGNIIYSEKPENCQNKLINQIQIKLDNNNIYEEKEGKDVEGNKSKDIDKDYSEIEFKMIDIMNGKEIIINLLNNNNKWDEKKKDLYY